MQTTVHPHVCGEIAADNVRILSSTGTSPRLWGDLIQGAMKGEPSRYIPTSVGRLVHDVVCPSVMWVHPHVCGEIVQPYVSDKTLYGTSPRLWGDLGGPALRPNIERYIPTSVGRLSRHCGTSGTVTVHPHVCGEIGLNRTKPIFMIGTSPRLWGDFLRVISRRPECRYIPTSVGRLKLCPSAMSLNSVHPHVCGEISRYCTRRRRDNGTSPRLWGDSIQGVTRKSY